MKIHNAQEFKMDAETLRTLARGDDPIRIELDRHRRQLSSSKALNGDSPTLAKKLKRRTQPKKSVAELRIVEEKPAGSESESDLKVGSDFKVRKNGTALSEITPDQEFSTPQQNADGSDVSTGKSLEHTSLQGERNNLRGERDELSKQKTELLALLNKCEPLERLNYEVLALKSYPSNETLVMARRKRDLWIMLCLFFFAVFVLGWSDLVPAWIAGIAFGSCVVCLSFSLSVVRGLFTKVPSHNELMHTRKELEYRAMGHIRALESSGGLAHNCLLLAAYNEALNNKRYQRLIHLSKKKMVVKAMRSVVAIRLYLQLLLDARQAYAQVKSDYSEVVRRLRDDFLD